MNRISKNDFRVITFQQKKMKYRRYLPLAFGDLILPIFFQKQQLAENCEEAREEVTKQLNKAMINDWDYQRELKNRQETDDKGTNHLLL